MNVFCWLNVSPWFLIFAYLYAEQRCQQCAVTAVQLRSTCRLLSFVDVAGGSCGEENLYANVKPYIRVRKVKQRKRKAAAGNNIITGYIWRPISYGPRPLCLLTTAVLVRFAAAVVVCGRVSVLTIFHCRKLTTFWSLKKTSSTGVLHFFVVVTCSTSAACYCCYQQCFAAIAILQRRILQSCTHSTNTESRSHALTQLTPNPAVMHSLN